MNIDKSHREFARLRLVAMAVAKNKLDFSGTMNYIKVEANHVSATDGHRFHDTYGESALAPGLYDVVSNSTKSIRLEEVDLDLDLCPPTAEAMSRLEHAESVSLFDDPIGYCALARVIRCMHFNVTINPTFFLPLFKIPGILIKGFRASHRLEQDKGGPIIEGEWGAEERVKILLMPIKMTP